MTQDEIIRMAREAGWDEQGNCLPLFNALERFAALVAAHEREQLENDCPAYIPYTEGELEEAKTLLMKAKSMDERFAFIWETIYDHGNGKHLGALSRAQREVAWFYLQQIQDVCKAIEAAVLAERERVMNEPLTKAMWDRFESEIRADEREACAKVCKDIANSQFESGETETAGVLDYCAAAIRARGQHE